MIQDTAPAVACRPPAPQSGHSSCSRATPLPSRPPLLEPNASLSGRPLARHMPPRLSRPSRRFDARWAVNARAGARERLRSASRSKPGSGERLPCNRTLARSSSGIGDASSRPIPWPKPSRSGAVHALPYAVEGAHGLGRIDPPPWSVSPRPRSTVLTDIKPGGSPATLPRVGAGRTRAPAFGAGAGQARACSR